MIFFTQKSARDRAIGESRGIYQRGLVNGEHRWSGSDIQNKWGAGYKDSRDALRQRLLATGLLIDEVVVDGKVFLVVGWTQSEINEVTPGDLLTIWR